MNTSREVAEVIEAWRTSPIRSHDGRLFDAIEALAEVHGINLIAALPPQAKAEPAGVSENHPCRFFNGRCIDCGRAYGDRAILSAAPSAGVRDITAALSSPGVERLRDFYAVGPVQRAAVECFVDALGVVGTPAHSKSEYKRRVAMGDTNVMPAAGVNPSFSPSGDEPSK